MLIIFKFLRSANYQYGPDILCIPSKHSNFSIISVSEKKKRFLGKGQIHSKFKRHVLTQMNSSYEQSSVLNLLLLKINLTLTAG